MKILINGLADSKGGGVTHLKNFISALVKIGSKNEYFLYLNKNISIDIEADNLKIIPCKNSNKSYMHRLIWDQIIINIVAKRINADYIFSMFNYGSIRSVAKQIVWQNSPAFCSYYQNNLGIKEKLSMKFRRIIAYLTMKNSILIIVPTFAWRNVILKNCTSILKEKIKVIYHGFNRKNFHRGQALPIEIERKINCEKNSLRLLLTSYPRRHKGFELLFQALKKIKIHTDFKLFLTIDPKKWPQGINKYQQAIKNLENNVVTLGPLPYESIVNLYRKADIFVFPSFCESFGFSMVEALSVGLPILASDTPVNREICGNAALYFNPESVDDISEKILLLFKDGKLKKELCQKALKRSEEFPTWENVVRDTLRVIKELEKEYK